MEDFEEGVHPLSSVEAEQAVLGGLMLDNRRLDDVLEILEAKDFYREDHKEIFKAICRLQENSDPFDVVTVSEALHNDNQLERTGGFSYLTELAANTPGAANIMAYASLVADRGKMRELHTALGLVGGDILGMTDPQEAIDFAQSKIMALEMRNGQSEILEINDVLKSSVQALDQRFRDRKEGRLYGLMSGWADIDKRHGGWRPGELVVIAGRPAQGKSILGMQIAQYNAIHCHKAGAVFSLEMPRAQLINRAISSQGQVPYGRLRNADLLEEDWPKVSNGVAMLKDAPIYIQDDPNISVQQLRAYSRKVARKLRQKGEKLEYVLVDHMLLVGGQGENRTNEVSDVSRNLKKLANELDCVVIALCQLNRGVERRPNKRPIMSDLKASGSIEEDADVVIFVYRDDYYYEDSPNKGIIEMLTRKSRDGETGDDFLVNKYEYMRAENLAPGYQYQWEDEE